MARPLNPDTAAVWSRHTPGCIAKTISRAGAVSTRSDGKVCRKCRSPQHTTELRYHALMTSVAMTGVRVFGVKFLCPACTRNHKIADGQVDRAVSNGDYKPGNVALLCKNCNMVRAHYPDSFDTKKYIAEVKRANRQVILRNGVLRGPKAFTPDMIALVKGSQTRCSNKDMANARQLIIAGQYGKKAKK